LKRYGKIKNKIEERAGEVMQKELLSVFGNLLTAAVSKGGGQQGKIESRVVEVDSEKYNYQVYIPPQIKARRICRDNFSARHQRTRQRRICSDRRRGGRSRSSLFRAGSGSRFAAAMPSRQLLVRPGDGTNGDQRARANRREFRAMKNAFI
jgi:hypothetical protein